MVEYLGKGADVSQTCISKTKAAEERSEETKRRELQDRHEALLIGTYKTSKVVEPSGTIPCQVIWLMT